MPPQHRLPVPATAEPSDPFGRGGRHVDVSHRVGRPAAAFTRPRRSSCPARRRLAGSGWKRSTGGRRPRRRTRRRRSSVRSLIWQPTARSSDARALPSSASTWAIWISTWSTSRWADRTVAISTLLVLVVALGELQRVPGAGQDAVAEQVQDVLLDPGLRQEVLDLAVGLVALGLVELGVGDGPLLGLADAGPVLLPVDRQVEADEQADVGRCRWPSSA